MHFVNSLPAVIHQALDQFYKLYNNRTELEETYLMGHRMISFLSEYLPRHPDYISPEVAELRQESLQELLHIRHCLEDVALRIDEYHVNKLIDEFDPILDDDSMSNGSFREGYGDVAEQRSTPIKQPPNANDEPWEPFANWGSESKRSKGADSLTIMDCTSTVVTTGTGSIEAYETSSEDISSEDNDPEPDFSDSDDESLTCSHVYSMELDELPRDFLKKIASEDVRYETDSEAMDSWAQDSDSNAPSASSGAGITCDPARLAFRNILKRLPRTLFASPVKEEDSLDEETMQEELLQPQSRIPLRESKTSPVEKQQQQHQAEEKVSMAETVSTTKTGKENERDVFSALVKPDVLERNEWVNFEIHDSHRRDKLDSIWNTHS
jgi:hypothetical protein